MAILLSHFKMEKNAGLITKLASIQEFLRLSARKSVRMEAASVVVK
jgi:hypothetical protein